MGDDTGETGVRDQQDVAGVNLPDRIGDRLCRQPTRGQLGIGIDYAVNIVQRYLIEGKGGVLQTVRQTGGAVVLCSLTTTLGYLALVSSVNFAVRSLGVAAVLGEISCLLAAVLVLPAA